MTSSPQVVVVTSGKGGVGKCFAAGTGILMADGSIKPVESVRNGDIVLGDDGAVRTVSGVTSGVDDMFLVREMLPATLPTGPAADALATSFVCNSAHILVLRLLDTAPATTFSADGSAIVEWLHHDPVANSIVVRRQRCASAAAAASVIGEHARPDTAALPSPWQVPVAQFFAATDPAVQARCVQYRPAGGVEYPRELAAPAATARVAADDAWLVGAWLVAAIEHPGSPTAASALAVPLSASAWLSRLELEVGDQTFDSGSSSSSKIRERVRRLGGAAAVDKLLASLGLLPSLTADAPAAALAAAARSVRRAVVAGAADASAGKLIVVAAGREGLAAQLRWVALSVGSRSLQLASGGADGRRVALCFDADADGGEVETDGAFPFVVERRGTGAYYGFCLSAGESADGDGGHRFVLANLTVTHNTTTCANLAYGLAERGYRVAAIDFDIGLRNLDLHLGLERRVIFDFINVIRGESSLQSSLVRDKNQPTLALLAASQTRDKTALTEEGVEKVLNELKKQFDFILCDSPAGIESGAHHAAYFADSAIIVTNPEVSSVRDSDKMLGMLASKTMRALTPGMDPIKVSLLVTRYNHQRSQDGHCLTLEDVKELLGGQLPLLGVIPENIAKVQESTNLGRPAIVEKSSAVSKAYTVAVSRMLGEDVPIPIFDNNAAGLFGKLKAMFGKTA